jgi:hypothetical protein
MKVQFHELTAFLEELALAVAAKQVEFGLVRRTYRYVPKHKVAEFQVMQLVAGYIEIRDDGQWFTRRLTELCLECGTLLAGDHERNQVIQQRGAMAMEELTSQVEALGLTLRGGRFVDEPSC